MNDFRSYPCPTRYGVGRGFVNAITLIVVLVLALAAMPARAAGDIRIVAFGDSLTAGLGLARADTFPVRLQRALRRDGRSVTVVNAGVSGDTTAGGLARLEWALAEKPDCVIVELGANDGLRGLDPQTTDRNLDTILTRLKMVRVRVLLTGMKAPPNLGREYGDAFAGIFPRLAAKHGVALYPFFLDGVAADPALNQDDGIHPNAKGVALIVRRMVPYLRDLLDQKTGGLLDKKVGGLLDKKVGGLLDKKARGLLDKKE